MRSVLPTSAELRQEWADMAQEWLDRAAKNRRHVRIDLERARAWWRPWDRRFWLKMVRKRRALAVAARCYARWSLDTGAELVRAAEAREAAVAALLAAFPGWAPEDRPHA